MKKKKQKKKQKEPLMVGRDFHYHFNGSDYRGDRDYDFVYDTVYNCDEEDCDGICRCGRIENIHVNHIPVQSLVPMLVHKAAKGFSKSNRIFEYCVERILVINKLYDVYLWDVSAVPGYYGEEIGPITFCELTSKKIEEQVKALKKMTTPERVEYVLGLEYKSVLRAVKGRSWSVKQVLRKDVVLRPDTKKRAEGESQFYKGYDGLVGVAYQDGVKYRLVDGYHRFTATDKEKVSLVVGVKKES